METPYEIRALNTLAFPKGKHPKCELTNVAATVQCETPYITLYYATREHAEQAWHGIMNKIVPLIGPLRENAGIIGSEEDRAKREYTLNMSKRALVELCEQEASKFLASGRHELAIPGAIQALSFLKELHGDGAMEMVSSYLLLAEANLGLGRFQQADEFLSLANWSVLQNPECSNKVRSKLHRNFGKLYSAQGKLNEALVELSKDIYCSSLEVGPEHVNTSAGYYYMASIFYTQHRIENALAFYDKVIDIWYKFVAAARTDVDLAQSLSSSQLSEGVDMVSFILQTRAKLLGINHIATGEARYTLGLLHIVRADYQEARECISAACDIYGKHLGSEHPSTRDVLNVLLQINQEPQQDDYN
jgi:tetratricopeptide (TPR) repeat protein